MAATMVSQRTRAFARVMGPWLVMVPGIIAIRAPYMDALATGFFANAVFIGFGGALLLLLGLIIIAFHQYWSNLAAILISAFGWFLALRGLVLLAVPGWYDRAAAAMSAVWLIQLLFAVIVVMGLYLAYVGWIARPPVADP